MRPIDNTLVFLLTVLHLGVMLAANAVVAVFAFRAYHRGADTGRALFYVGVSCALGLVATICGGVSTFVSLSIDARFQTWVVATSLTVIDMVIFAWAMCSLLKKASGSPLIRRNA